MKLLFRAVFANWPIRVTYHERGINSIAGGLLHKIIKCFLKYGKLYRGTTMAHTYFPIVPMYCTATLPSA
jgi:hypothetical protein